MAPFLEPIAVVIQVEMYFMNALQAKNFLVLEFVAIGRENGVTYRAGIIVIGLLKQACIVDIRIPSRPEKNISWTRWFIAIFRCNDTSILLTKAANCVVMLGCLTVTYLAGIIEIMFGSGGISGVIWIPIDKLCFIRQVYR